MRPQLQFWITRANWVVPGSNTETTQGKHWQYRVAEEAGKRVVDKFPETLRRLADS